MQITIDLPPVPTEDELTEQFTHLIDMCRGLLSEYKKKGFTVPTLAIRTNKPKIAVVSESKQFVDELLAYHLKRVPTANIPQQRSILKKLYEAGHTDTSRLKALYEEKLKIYRDCSWSNVKWMTGQPEATERVADELSFQRADLSESAIEELARRFKGND